MALIGFRDISIAFGGPPILDGVELTIQPNERVCLLGRNGGGKTTLLRIAAGAIEPDAGIVARQQGLRVAMLIQEPPGEMPGTVFDVVMDGLGERGRLTSEYHRLSHLIATDPAPPLLEKLDRLQKRMEAEGGWEIHREAETIITRMGLDGDAAFNSLSSGMRRRVLLARALAGRPDLLLLDEPTNHLDIHAIAWLEEFLLKYPGSLLFVTHDRLLVRKLSTRIIELDRGRLYNWNCDYANYLERKDAALEAEKNQWENFDKKLAREEDWIRQGVKARRTRNEGRVKALIKMREERLARRELTGTARISPQEAQRSGKLAVIAENISFSYHNSPLIANFSTVIMRGDRVGVIGPNGSGKTTLLRLLLGQIPPQSGEVKLGTNLHIIYFDQLRSQLDDEKTVQENVAEGGDRIDINGKNRHIIGYLQEFLFTPDRSRSPVKVLSGGERNRLLLAKLFAKPSNLIVMDEPTNDLDVETLELLEEVLLNYNGSVLLVSHDRAFLNNVVTSTLVLEGGGRVNEYIGGYDDWIAQRPKPAEPTADRACDAAKIPPESREKTKTTPPTANRPSRKLSNKEREELESLPLAIESLENEQHHLYQQLADPAFYKKDPSFIPSTQQRLETVKSELEKNYRRWEELEELKNILDAKKV